jgi:leucyl aminopeptidase
MTQVVVEENEKSHPGLNVFFVAEGKLDGMPAGPDFRKLAAQEKFEGKKDQSLTLFAVAGSPRTLLVGLGKAKDVELEGLRRAACRAARQARDLKAGEAAFHLPASSLGKPAPALAAALAEGIWLGLYRYREFFSKPDDRKDPARFSLRLAGIRSLAPVREAVLRAGIACESALWVRDLVNRPPSHFIPADFGREAARVKARGKNVTLKVLNKAQIQKLKMGGLLGVSLGSDKPPIFVHLHYKPARPRKTVALVGKGITFDSGGLSLKPANSMEDMKSDMAGAASVLGIVLAASRMGLPVEIHGLCAVTENMPGPGALKPGDVLTAMNGKTMEVLNTDAEGRLVLADALSYGSRLKPDVMIDMATLTGAAIVALGNEVTAALGDQKVVDALKAAGEMTGEKFWQLPLVPEYKDHIKSRLADMKNIGRAGQAGTIIGGLFLQEFVDNVPWVHLDIAGPSFLSGETGYLAAGATGIPVRTILNYLEAL